MKFEICVDLDTATIWYGTDDGDQALRFARRQINRRGAQRVVVYGPTGAVEAEFEN